MHIQNQRTLEGNRRYYAPLLLFVVFFFLNNGCSKEEEFIFDINDLLETQWGIPQIIEPGEGHIDLDAPTVFHADGLVTIGTARTDYWTTFGTRSILLQQAQQVWFIIDLSPERLYVEKNTHPQGQFIVKCIYEPLKK
ncbi:MAG: hypothetical protein ACOC12_01930 [Bacteroidota bacterium]